MNSSAGRELGRSISGPTAIGQIPVEPEITGIFAILALQALVLSEKNVQKQALACEFP
jgi:hypothetical protein